MKTLFTILILSLLLASCGKNNPVEPTTKIITKIDTVYVPDTVYVHADTVKLQFQLNTDSINSNVQYLVYADYDGNGYSYQPIDETVYRGNYQEYYLQWTFQRSQIKNDVAKFRLIEHPFSGIDTQLGIVYYYK